MTWAYSTTMDKTRTRETCPSSLFAAKMGKKGRKNHIRRITYNHTSHTLPYYTISPTPLSLALFFPHPPTPHTIL